MTTSRRKALENGWKVGKGLLLGSAAWTSLEALRPLATGTDTGVLKLSGPFAEGTATYVPAGRCYVTRVHNRLFAITQQCPHLGCRVPFCASSGYFECPCHGSVFGLAGEWLSGPSPNGMDRFELTEEAGEVVVDLSKRIQGFPLGSRAFFTPPRGPSCGSEDS